MGKQTNLFDLEPTPPRTDMFNVDVRQMKIDEGFNVREDYGNIDELADSIRENGIKVPLRAYRNKENLYVIIDGHRRFMACQKLLKEGLITRLPVIKEAKAPAEEQEKQRVFDILLCSEGKKLTPLEESTAVQRLIAFGYEPKDIAKKIGKSGTYIQNLILLASAPEKLKGYIRSERMAASTIINVLKAEKNFENASDLIEKAYSIAANIPNVASSEEEAPAPIKITEKDIQEAQGNINSWSELKKALAKAEKEEMEHKEGMAEMLEFAINLVNGKLNRQQILDLLFEPVLDEEYEEQPED